MASWEKEGFVSPLGKNVRLWNVLHVPTLGDGEETEEAGASQAQYYMLRPSNKQSTVVTSYPCRVHF